MTIRSFFFLIVISLINLPLLLKAQTLEIPPLTDLPRIDRSSPRPEPNILRNSAFILKMKKHEVSGTGYVILSDHDSPEFLTAIDKLAKFRQGTVLRMDDLGAITELKGRAALLKRLLELDPKYVAVAPKIESYRENILLGLWEVFSTLDDDPFIDVYPGILLASNAENFQRFIDRTINHRAISQKELRLMAISQVPSAMETRSLQKAGILRETFAEYGLETPTLAVYTPAAKNAAKLEGKDLWNIHLSSKGDYVKTLSSKPEKALNAAQLVVMHGHGIPGMSCSIDIKGIPTNSANRVILTGSCFSAVPVKSDLPRMSSAPGGYKVDARPAFAMEYLDRDAVVFFGHMRLSSGFPHLFPVLENWMQGETVGSAYQQLLNAIINMRGFRSGGFVIPTPITQRNIRQNTLLYVVFGDPALTPFEKLKK
ncbi:MAG: hypothetical protein CMJ76_09890 [Planctomycetaceae bacterium]|nr:hypothetical protein [Planctomycetaceae bacterium]